MDSASTAKLSDLNPEEKSKIPRDIETCFFDQWATYYMNVSTFMVWNYVI